MEDIISRSSDEYKVLDEAMRKSKKEVQKLLSLHQPSIGGERYLSTEEVCEKFNISRRALQKYRDN